MTARECAEQVCQAFELSDPRWVKKATPFIARVQAEAFQEGVDAGKAAFWLDLVVAIRARKETRRAEVPETGGVRSGHWGKSG